MPSFAGNTGIESPNLKILCSILDCQYKCTGIIFKNQLQDTINAYFTIILRLYS